MAFRVEALGLSQQVARLQFVSKNFNRDMRRVMGSAARIAPVEATRAATSVYAVKRQRIAKSWKVGTINKADLSFVLTGSAEAITLASYSLRKTGRGLSVSVLKGRRSIIGGSFLARSPFSSPDPNDKVTLLPFRRTRQRPRVMKQGLYKGRLRTPIEVLLGPSPADMLNNPKVFEPMATQFIERAEREILRLLAVALDG